eukprot:Hpha_TRINITY_DN1663_c0_g1::TRINITY_DN1663_c0_g1_i1::g.48741::m.48741
MVFIVGCFVAAVVGAEYVDPLNGYGCTGTADVAYIKGEKRGSGMTDAQCEAFCDADSGCIAYEQYEKSGCGNMECWTYTKCTKIRSRSSCNRIMFKATSVSPQWKVGCGESGSCCTAVGQCFYTVNYPSDYKQYTYCVASQQPGTYRGSGSSEKNFDEIHRVQNGAQYSGTNINFDSTTGAGVEHVRFESNGCCIQKRGFEICKDTVSPTVSPTLSPQPPSIPPTMAPTDPTAAPTASPTLPPTSQPSAVPTASPSLVPSSPPSASPVSPTETPSAPTTSPTLSPSQTPTNSPVVAPTSSPLLGPTTSPATPPSAPPTSGPTRSPVSTPTTSPRVSPTASPYLPPTLSPSAPSATSPPSLPPSTDPTVSPIAPTTLVPSSPPSASPLSPTATPTTTPPSLSP